MQVQFAKIKNRKIRTNFGFFNLKNDFAIQVISQMKVNFVYHNKHSIAHYCLDYLNFFCGQA